MKKVYLVHCWGGSIDVSWYPWLKSHLENNNIEVIMADMPNTEEPKINEWVPKLDSLVDNLDENTYFIGHSIGCQTIMRYLETKKVTKIGGIFFVTPWLDLLPDQMDEDSNEIAYEWINTPIDFDKIKEFTNNINALFSDDDYYVSLEQEKEFKDKLGAETTIVKGMGHISFEEDINELPEILSLTGKVLGLEFVEIVDNEGNPTGEILDKEIAHDRNLLHKHVRLILLNPKNEILIQKRDVYKRFNANKWAFCSGHVEAYEYISDAVLRELKEELGINGKKEDIIHFDTSVKIRKANSSIVYIHYMFLDKDSNEFVIQEEELSEVKWILFDEYKQMVINNDESITLSNNSENLRMLEKLERILDEKVV